MKSIFLIVLALAFSPFAVAATLEEHELERREALSEARDGIQFMDVATPEELERQLELFSGLNEEMVPEDPAAAYMVRIRVNIANQTLTMSSPAGMFSTAISSARPGYRTRTGCYSRPHLELMHYSSIYENAPMPHSMFYSGGFAIHGTYEERHLGRPASHGCVRVSRAAAAFLYGIVKRYGSARTLICVR
jgi:hypothetical protein